MKIGELARLAGSNVETIRYYERDGLLPVPARSVGNYRIYGETHVQRLFFIRHCRSLDMTLDEIRVLLHFKESPQENCADVNRLLDRHIGHVAQRMQELQELERQLKDLRERCGEAQDAAHCGILDGLSQAFVSGGKTASHVQGTHRHGANRSLAKGNQGNQV
jgi:Cd(II)/Pb(II)-responsive transcriptional regulator